MTLILLTKGPKAQSGDAGNSDTPQYLNSHTPVSEKVCVYSRSSNNVSFIIISLQHLRGKKSVLGQGHCVDFAHSPHVLWFFSGSCSSFPPPKHVHMRWTGVSPLSQSEWMWVWVARWWKRILFRVGPANRGSSHLWLWTKISRLESNDLPYFP